MSPHAPAAVPRPSAPQRARRCLVILALGGATACTSTDVVATGPGPCGPDACAARDASGQGDASVAGDAGIAPDASVAGDASPGDASSGNADGPPPCGARDQACCGGTSCDSFLICTQEGTCSCGQQYQPCCDGLFCYGDGVWCSATTCITL
ncbi:MAG TPA: hypothetical protein VGQ83_00175 [Polyangia bacterium]